MLLMNHLKCQGLSQQHRDLTEVCDSASLFFYKRKDGGAQWLYR
ncbi:DUF4102 domain-containing protein [Bartonella sp. AU18XJBT]|nr:DUF4102 domain-containing protein [Bartonella sp. AU18XJBT]